MKNPSMEVLGSKVAAVTLSFWLMKIAATTLGETAGDLLSITLNLGYAVSSALLVAAFIALLTLQLSARRFHPVLFWSVVLATSTAGTTMSDLLDRTLGLGYAMGSTLLATCLALVLLAWRKSERSISVSDIGSRRAEVFYWTAVLFSNTLGTALGDFLADDSGLGFVGGAALIGILILATALATRIRNANKVILFWIAFVLTRPFGATFGDLLTKPLEKGGLDFGTMGSSLILFTILACLVSLSMLQRHTTENAR
ncbi:MAG: COG4705 family protein [Pseudoxanthomonas sp.]